MKPIIKLFIFTFLFSMYTSSVRADSLRGLVNSGTISKEQMNKINRGAEPSLWKPFDYILERMGLEKINIQISRQEVDRQQKAMKKGIRFELALQKAMKNVLSDPREEKSVARISLKKVFKENNLQYQFPAPQSIAQKAEQVAKKMINKGDVNLRLFSKDADRGEKAVNNWIFYLYAPRIERKGFFIIVEKSGRKQPYNYVAFASHNAEDEGTEVAAPEIPVVECGLGRGYEFPGAREITQGKGKTSPTLESLRRQGRVLYENYGAQFTMVKYDGWPGNIPIYGVFAQPYRNYLSNARKIDQMRIDIRGKWVRLNEDLTIKEAEQIVNEMKQIGREYDRLIGECLKFVRQGQQLYAEGKATFPSLLYNIKLKKGSTYVDLYDDNGKKIMQKKCVRWETKYSFWGSFTSFYGLGGSPYYVVCAEYKEVPVRAKVPDYYLEYGYEGDQVYPHRARMIDVPPTPAFPEVFLQESIKRDQYDMEVTVTCALDKDPNKGWLITKARLRKGRAAWTNSVGVGVTVGGKVKVPLVAEGSVSVSVNAGITWSHFRFGQMVEFPEFIGKPCFELGKGRIVAKK